MSSLRAIIRTGIHNWLHLAPGRVPDIANCSGWVLRVVISPFAHRLVARQRGTTQKLHRLLCNLMCYALSNDLSMPGKAILHDQRSEEGTVTALNTGQAGYKCPEPVLS
eukprot:6192330-Pleurochrysis_carterae.AAC.2